VVEADRASTTIRLAHTPKPDTIASLPVRRQRRSKGLEVVEADRTSTTMRLAHTPELDTLAGGTHVRMYRQYQKQPFEKKRKEK
jgi:hypothetical protein